MTLWKIPWSPNLRPRQINSVAHDGVTCLVDYLPIPLLALRRISMSKISLDTRTAGQIKTGPTGGDLAGGLRRTGTCGTRGSLPISVHLSLLAPACKL